MKHLVQPNDFGHYNVQSKQHYQTLVSLPSSSNIHLHSEISSKFDKLKEVLAEIFIPLGVVNSKPWELSAWNPQEWTTKTTLV